MIPALVLLAIFVVVLVVGGVAYANLSRRVATLERQNQQLIEMISSAVVDGGKPRGALEMELRNLLVEERR